MLVGIFFVKTTEGGKPRPLASAASRKDLLLEKSCRRFADLGRRLDTVGLGVLCGALMAKGVGRE